MERLVSGLAKIKFQQNCDDILVEKRVTNMATWLSATKTNSNDSDTDSKYNSASNSSKTYDRHTEDVDTTDVDKDAAGIGNSLCGARFSERRNLPQRACKENNTLKLKRRSIMKPKRNISRTCDFSMLRPADIKKIYTNRKLTNFRPTNLETIFEEPQPAASHSRANVTTSPDTNPVVRLIGGRKIRRSLSCSDGLNVNKAKQRRAKVKKVFGRRGTFKKISLTDFLERLNKSLGAEDDDNDETGIASNSCAEPMEAEMMTVIEATTNTSFVQTKTIAVEIDDVGGGVNEPPLIGICNDTDMIYKCSSFSSPDYGSATASATAAIVKEITTSTVVAERTASVAMPSAQFNFMGGIVRL